MEDTILKEVEQLVAECSSLSVEDLKKQTGAEQTALYTRMNEAQERMNIRKVQLDTKIDTSQKTLAELVQRIQKDYNVDTLEKLETVQETMLQDFHKSCGELQSILSTPPEGVESV